MTDTYREISPEAFDRCAEIFARMTALRQNIARRKTMASKLAALTEIKKLDAERRTILGV